MGGKNIPANLESLSAGLDKTLAESEIVATLRLLLKTDQRLQGGRPLNPAELQRLESQGNLCADWSRVRLANSAPASARDGKDDGGLSAIRNNRFSGDILIEGFHGACTDSQGRSWPAGMWDCDAADAIIGNACLRRIARLQRQVISDGAVLVGLGELDCPAPTLFGLGSAIHPGTEAGSRSVWILDPLTLDDCMDALSLTTAAQKNFREKLAAALTPLTSRFGYVGQGATILHTRRVVSAYIAPGTAVIGASLIRESALLSAPDERCIIGDDGWIEHSLLQPGAGVESGGKVSHSILLEHASVAWGGMVIQSVVGPNTQIHKGEMTACVLGPFVGFHHQSLLISALWPEGRGNIAYGANVGSNHTGRKPDQEIRPGEGAFFGLGCTIKFPADFRDAPYSLIAAGTCTLPQRMAFPFSLINQPSAGIPELGPAINEIIPGWMWSDNVYSLLRRSYKSETSDQARRHRFGPDASSTWKTGFFAGRIFHPELAAKVLHALQSLRAAPAGQAYHLDAAIPGLGKNFLRSHSRDRGMAAYQDYLIFFLFRSLTDGSRTAGNKTISILVTNITKELFAGTDLKAFISAQRSRIPALKQSIHASLLRDDTRGRQILPDYADFHPTPESDPTLLRLDQDLAQLNQRLDAYLSAP